MVRNIFLLAGGILAHPTAALYILPTTINYTTVTATSPFPPLDSQTTSTTSFLPAVRPTFILDASPVPPLNLSTSTAAASVSASAPVLPTATSTSTPIPTFTLVSDYTGQNLFNSFDFFTSPDPTHGHVTYVDLSTANTTGLAGFISGGPNDGAVYLGVDSTNITPNGRPSIRLQSQQTYNHALTILDVSHMPTGCGVWPSFWLFGTSSPWPQAGEIDIIEGVNLQTANSMALHSIQGVTVANTTADGRMTGVLETSDCNVDNSAQGYNVGCKVSDSTNKPDTASFGSAFNDRQGGIFAILYDPQGIRIWFFPRSSIPDDIAADAPTPYGGDSGGDAWGVPNAFFKKPDTTTATESEERDEEENWDKRFCELQIVIGTTFCGDWAGKVWEEDAECGKLAPTCDQHVTDHPEAFEDAFWAVRGLKVFQVGEGQDGYLR